MRRLVAFVVVVLIVATNAAGSVYDFSRVSPSGHTLFYKIQYGHAVVVAEMFAMDQVRFTPEHEPAGHLVIPATVSYNNQTYNVTRITGYVFSYCTSLTGVTIPSTIDSIGDGAFRGCVNLRTFISQAVNPPTLQSSQCFLGVSFLDLTVPVGCVSSYRSSGWNTVASSIHEPLPDMFELSLTSSDTACGTIVGAGLFPVDSVVSFWALPSFGCAFGGWSDGATSNLRHITITTDTSITAYFYPASGGVVHDTVAIGGTEIASDTLYLDTLIVYDTIVEPHYWFIHDTVYAYITQYVHDTIPDTVVVPVHDTVIATVYRYVYDTIYVDTLLVPVHDTIVAVVDHYVYDTLVVPVHDTVIAVVTQYVYDTFYLDREVHDTLYFVDTVYLYDTVYSIDTVFIHDTIYVPSIYLPDVEGDKIVVTARHRMLHVEAPAGLPVRVFDSVGRQIAITDGGGDIPLPSAGVYIVRIAEAVSRRVAVR